MTDTQNDFLAAKAENAKTLEILQSIKPVRPDDIAERDRQLSNASKMAALLADIESTLKL